MRSKLNPLKLVRNRVLTDSVATQICEGWGKTGHCREQNQMLKAFQELSES